MSIIFCPSYVLLNQSFTKEPPLKTLNSHQAALALAPLVLAVGYLCQLNDDTYLFPGIFYACTLFLYLALAHPWYRFTVQTLAITYALAIGVALIGVVREGNAIPLVILASWAALHYGPKESTRQGREFEQLPEPARKTLMRWKYITVSFWLLTGTVFGVIAGGALDDAIRDKILEQRYLARGCPTVVILENAVLCRNPEGQPQFIQAFFDYKGHHPRYRLEQITGAHGILTKYNYNTGRPRKTVQARFTMTEGLVKISQEGYGVLHDEQGRPQTDSVMHYQADRWLNFEQATPEALTTLGFAP